MELKSGHILAVSMIVGTDPRVKVAYIPIDPIGATNFFVY